MHASSGGPAEVPAKFVGAGTRQSGADKPGKGGRFEFRQGSALSKLEPPSTVTAFVTKEELSVLRNTMRGFYGERDSFSLRYRVLEAAALSPDCGLTWWPPSEDMMAIIERTYRAALGLETEKLLSVTANFAEEASQSPTSTQSGSFKNVEPSGVARTGSVISRAASGTGEGGLTIEAMSEVYQELLKHQKEQTMRFDKVIAKGEEQRRIEEANERIRAEEAEKARREKERKEQEELDAILKRGGKAAKAQLTQLRAKRAAADAEAAAAPPSTTKNAQKNAIKLYEKAWPGGTLTVQKLEAAFVDLPETPSGTQARYFFSRRNHYCDEAVGQDFLSTEGFAALVRDLVHLQTDLAADRKVALARIFKKIDVRCRGEISLTDILVQIDTEERDLLMPMVNTLLKSSDESKNGLLDIEEFPLFHNGWTELHRIFEIYDDCRMEESWSDRYHLEGLLSFAEVELLSSVFLGIKSKNLHGRNQVALMGPAIFSLDLTTPNASPDEIETAVSSIDVRADAVDFTEFLELHRKVRWLRTNPAQVRHRAASMVHISLIHNPNDAHGGVAGKAAVRSPSAKCNVERSHSTGVIERSQSSVLAEENQLMEKLKAMKALSEEQHEAIRKLQLFERRKQMSDKVSSLMIEAILKYPVSTNRSTSFSSMQSLSKTFSPSLKMDSVPTIRERSVRDVQELCKLFRCSPDLQDLPNETATRLAQRCTAFFFAGKANIYDLKDWGSGFWIIVVGVANVYMCGSCSKKAKVSEVRSGQCFGEMFLLFGEHLPRRFKVEAGTDGVLAAFIERDDYFELGLDVFHRSTVWKGLSNKHELMLKMQTLSHLDPTEKFHVCYQLREKTVLARTELYNSDTDYVEAPKADLLFRDLSVLDHTLLYLVQAGSCDVWVDEPKVEKHQVPTFHERDLSNRAHFNLHGEKTKKVRVSSLAPGGMFGSFATGPKVRKITASESCSVTVYVLKSEEAVHRLRREGIQRVFSQRDSREDFIVSRLETAQTSQKEVSGFLKGERNLKDLGSMLTAPALPKRRSQTPQPAKPAHSDLEPSFEQSVGKSKSMETIQSMDDAASFFSIKSQYSSENVSSKIHRAVEAVGGRKVDKCHIPNNFGSSKKHLDLMLILSHVRKPLAKDRSGLVTRGAPPTVPDFSKSPEWLDTMGYRFTVPVHDKLKSRESEAQQKLEEAFLIYENWQNTGRMVDLHRFIDLMKLSHLVGNKSDPRDNLLTSISMQDAIEVFKQVQNSALPTASLLKGRNSLLPSFDLTRFSFTQCMHLIAGRLNVPLPHVHNYPIDAAQYLPASNKSTRDQINMGLSGRPGSSAYAEKIHRRPATSCGFHRATGMRENTADTLGRDFPGPDTRPQSSAVKVLASSPGSACVVSMLVSPLAPLQHVMSSLPSRSEAQGLTTSRTASPSHSPTNYHDKTEGGVEDKQRAKSVMDRIYGSPTNEGVYQHIEHERNKRTRSIKRSLKRLRLPLGVQQVPDKPSEKAHQYQMLQAQLYGHEPGASSLHWLSPSVVDHQIHAPPALALHEHLHSTPVLFSSLSRPSIVAAQIKLHQTIRLTLAKFEQQDPVSLSRPATSMGLHAPQPTKREPRAPSTEGRSSKGNLRSDYLRRTISGGSTSVDPDHL